jgi:myo-inositol-1-phosphate synthase
MDVMPIERTTRQDHPEDARTGVAIIGLGGAVATTAVAGVEQLKLGAIGTHGLPLAHRADLVPYESLVFGGWDLDSDDLAKAAHLHRVLESAQIEAVAEPLQQIEPWPAVANPAYCRNATGANVVATGSLRGQVAHVRADLRRFRREHGLDSVVVVNLASTEAWPDLTSPVLADIETFEKGLDRDEPVITPGMIYTYASITEGCPFVNFTASLGPDVPALLALAEREGVPVAGKDGKTGQTLMKTVLAPAFRSRALTVEGWYSTNILGNRDGHVLDDPSSRASKLDTSRTTSSASTTTARVATPKRRGTTSIWSASWATACNSRSIFCAVTRSWPPRSCWSSSGSRRRRVAAARVVRRSSSATSSRCRSPGTVGRPNMRCTRRSGRCSTGWTGPRERAVTSSQVRRVGLDL